MQSIDVYVEQNDACDGCALRFKAEDSPQEVHLVRTYADDDHPIVCRVIGMSPAGPLPALRCTIEDSSSGTAVLVWGGEWGLRLTPVDGGETFGESHLRLAPDDILE